MNHSNSDTDEERRERWFPNTEQTHEIARNSRYPARNWDTCHCDPNAEIGETRLELCREEGTLLLARERYGGVLFEDATERDGSDTGLVTYNWYRDEVFELTEKESREALDLLSGWHTIDTETIRTRAEKAMEELAELSGPTHKVESNLQHIHARSGGEMDELYPDTERDEDG